MSRRTRVRPSASWGNRVLGTAAVPANQLLANEQNWRLHGQEQQTLLADLLRAVGFVQGVIVNKRSAASWGVQRHVETVVDGHLRVQLALSRDEETPVPVVYVDLEPDEERLVLTTFDPVGALAGADRERLDELVGTLPNELAAIAKALHQDRRAVRKLVTFEAEQRFRIVVECADEGARQALVTRLTAEGYDCRAE